MNSKILSIGSFILSFLHLLYFLYLKQKDKEALFIERNFQESRSASGAVVFFILGVVFWNS